MNSRSIRYAFCAVLVLLLSSHSARAQSCNADITGDGIVDGKDLAIVLSAWGACPVVISSVSPLQGSILGGTEITITGSGFYSVSAVLVGGAPCTDVRVVSPSEIRASTPPSKPGHAVISVTAYGGAASSESQFNYVPAVVPDWATLIENYPDPLVVHDPGLREAIRDTGYAWRVRDNVTQIEMVLLPPGTFQMGCTQAGSPDGCSFSDTPDHQVTLTQPFYMGLYEVSQAQWTAVTGSNPAYHQTASAQVPASEVPNRPVDQVSWIAVQSFLSATGMRLPTEAEWEYAYRAGTNTAYHSIPGYPQGTNDQNLAGLIAWFRDNSIDQTRPVGQLSGNGFGLHDMAGNVIEWVSDRWDYYTDSSQVDPTGGCCSSWRLLRGGSFGAVASYCTASDRGLSEQWNSSPGWGFRVARNP